MKYEEEESLKWKMVDDEVSPHSKTVHTVPPVQTVHTCRELKTVKSQANTAVLSLIANSPNTQVSPSRGRRITEAFTRELVYKIKVYACECKLIIEGPRTRVG